MWCRKMRLAAGSMAMMVTMLLPLSANAEAEAEHAADAAGARVIITADESLRMYFSPETLTVPAGTTVTFANEDGSNHKIKFADGTISERLRHGASYTRTFSAPGTYAYGCAIHSKMKGTIVVE